MCEGRLERMKQVQSNVLLQLRDSDARGWSLGCSSSLPVGIRQQGPSTGPCTRSKVKENNEHAQCFSHLPFCCVCLPLVLSWRHCLWPGLSALPLPARGEPVLYSLCSCFQILDCLSVYLKHCLHSSGKYGSHSILRGWGLTLILPAIWEESAPVFSGLGYKQHCLCRFHSPSPLFVQALTQVGLFCI